MNNSYFKLDGDKVIKTTFNEIIEKGEISKTLLSTKIQIYNYNIIVSTVFMSQNHNLYDIKPIVFETMIFDSFKNSIFEYYQERYSTLKDAQVGHIDAINYVYKYIAENNEK